MGTLGLCFNNITKLPLPQHDSNFGCDLKRIFEDNIFNTDVIRHVSKEAIEGILE